MMLPVVSGNTRSTSHIFFTALCILILGACSNTDGILTTNTPDTSIQEATAPPVSNKNTEDTPIINDVVTQPIIEENSTLPDINTLAGLDPRSIENLMGAPDLKRTDGNIQVFLYESSACVLEVILRENTNGELKSESLKTRDRQGNAVDKSTCLKSLSPDGWQN